MTKYVGRRVQLGIAREATRGTPVAPAFQVPRTTFSFDDKIVQVRSIGALGRIEDSEEAFVTTKYGQGDVEGEIRANSFGLFLYAMLGGYSVSGPTDLAYTHAFSVANTNLHQSLAFLVVDANTTEMYPLVMLDSLEISVELDQVIRYNASFMSKKGNTSSAEMTALADEPKFTKKHLSFRVASTIGGITGESLSLKSLTLTISKNVILDDVLGTAEPEDILNRQLSVEGQLTLSYEDETWKNYMKDGTNRAVEIALTNTDEVIGAGATNPSLTIQMPKVDFFDWEPDYSLEEIASQTISFKANYDVANLLAIISTCQLVNSTETYT